MSNESKLEFTLTMAPGEKAELISLPKSDLFPAGKAEWLPAKDDEEISVRVQCQSMELYNQDFSGWSDVEMNFEEAQWKKDAKDNDGAKDIVSGMIYADALVITGKKDEKPMRAKLSGEVEMHADRIKPVASENEDEIQNLPGPQAGLTGEPGVKDGETEGEDEESTLTGTETGANEYHDAKPSALSFAPIVLLALVAGIIAGVSLERWFKRKKRVHMEDESLKPVVRPYEHTSKAVSPPPVNPTNVQTASITVGTLHNIGKRPSQQDSLDALVLKDGGALAVVADGMGGLSDGDKVSQMIVRTIHNDAVNQTSAHLSENLLALITHANTEVNHMLGFGAAPERYKSGSTLVLAVMEYGQFRYASVGDSRIYLFRNGGLIQINREHIYEAELLQYAVNREMSFAEARSHPKRKSVTSFVGMGSLRHVDACLNPIRTLPGDKLLLCSDGVFNALSEEEIAWTLSSGRDAVTAAKTLEKAVLDKNIQQQDNFSAVLVFYG